MNLIFYAQRLSKAAAEQNKAALEDLCFDLELSQLERDYWALDVFDFFTNALQDKAICAMNGSSALIMALYNDVEKLTEEQTAKLLTLFDKRADAFGDEMLRHAVGDMVARKYPPETAMKLFTK